ncbi:MAG: hypothetical protein HYZ28_23505 [Myxococcales bacterium]|nr:hypothetical protein [Myxococcales bacterium]
MTFELTDRQAEELRLVLESQLKRLLDEIAHSDDRAFRHSLQGSYDLLDELRQRLSAEIERAQVYV